MRIASLIAALGSVFSCVSLLALTAISLQSGGETVAELDLISGPSEVTLSLSAGDRLTFRSTVAAEADKKRSFEHFLRSSSYTITLEGQGLAPLESRCGVYGSVSAASVGCGDTYTQHGLSNDCSLQVSAPGQYTLKVRADWAPVTPKRADLEVMRASRP